MIGIDTQNVVRAGVETFWRNEERLYTIVDLAKGKESGHRIADRVDEETCEYLRSNFETTYQRGRDGIELARSMGDIWLKDNDLFHPINVKTSTTDLGAPNLVSLKKLVTALLKCQIDSYYLLIIKLTIDPANSYVRVFFVDLLDYLDYVRFDSGPGQIMLITKEFYAFLDTGKEEPRLELLEKIDKLLRMLESADKTLLANRNRKRKQLQEQFHLYKRGSDNRVTLANQEKLGLSLQI